MVPIVLFSQPPPPNRSSGNEVEGGGVINFKYEWEGRQSQVRIAGGRGKGFKQQGTLIPI